MDIAPKTPVAEGGPAGSGFLGATSRIMAERLEAIILVNILIRS